MKAVDLSALAQDPEPRFVEIGKNQPEYLTLPALVYNDGKTLIEFDLTEEERTKLIRGERIRLWIYRSLRCSNCQHPHYFEPIAIEVTDEQRA